MKIIERSRCEILKMLSLLIVAVDSIFSLAATKVLWRKIVLHSNELIWFSSISFSPFCHSMTSVWIVLSCRFRITASDNTRFWIFFAHTLLLANFSMHAIKERVFLSFCLNVRNRIKYFYVFQWNIWLNNEKNK